TRRFVANGVCQFPIGVDVAGGQRRAGLGMLVEAIFHGPTPCSDGGRGSIEIQRRGRSGLNDVVIEDDFAFTIEAWWLAQDRDGPFWRPGGCGFRNGARFRNGASLCHRLCLWARYL